MSQLIERYQELIGCPIEALAEEIRLVVCRVVGNPLVVWRVKDPEALKKKMLLKKTEDVFRIKDVYGIKVLVASIPEVYQALESIEHSFPGFLKHDYVAKPKTSEDLPGKELRLLHYIGLRNGVEFEIQISTKEFDPLNEALHPRYHLRKYGA